MKLMDMTVDGFVNELASNSPAPGGGTIAAVNGAFAAGLGVMTCLLTIPRETDAERKHQLTQLAKQLNQSKERFVQLADEDTEAFNQVMAAFRMPKATEEEKAVRKEAIALANLGATLVPVETAGISVSILLVLKEAVSLVNDNVLSDCGVALSCARTAADGAFMNIAINLPGVKNETRKSEIEASLQELKQKAQTTYEEAMTIFEQRFSW